MRICGKLLRSIERRSTLIDRGKACGACNELEAYWQKKLEQQRLDLEKMARDTEARTDREEQTAEEQDRAR